MTDDPPRLHPLIAAALERDQISLPKLAELVDLDVRTIEKTRKPSPTEERAVKYRRLDAWIEGRTRAVQVDGRRWELADLGEGVPPAMAESVAARMVAIAEHLEAEAGKLREEAKKLSGSHSGRNANDGIGIAVDQLNRNAAGLTSHSGSPKLPDMINTNTLQLVSREAEQSARGARRNRSLRLTEEEEQRINAAAAKHGMTLSEFLRTLGWMFSG